MFTLDIKRERESWQIAFHLCEERKRVKERASERAELAYLITGGEVTYQPQVSRPKLFSYPLILVCLFINFASDSSATIHPMVK